VDTHGRHRLAAGKVLGLKQITALISPDESLAYRILALNTEKAHNLKDRSLEVIAWAQPRQAPRREREDAFAAEFEAAELLTLGIVYEKSPRFAGGAYSAFLKKVDRFSERTLAVSLRQREDHAARLAEIDARSRESSPPCRRAASSPHTCATSRRPHQPGALPQAKKGDTQPPMPLAQALTRMAAAARNFNLGSVSNSDLAWVAWARAGGIRAAAEARPRLVGESEP